MNTLIYDPDGAKNAITIKTIWQILEECPELKSELLKAILDVVDNCFENNDGYIDDKLRTKLTELFEGK